MTFSKLMTGTLPHHGKYGSRGGKSVERIILHHWAGKVGGDARLGKASEKVSCSYLVYGDGRIVGQVPEEYRPWTSSSSAADSPSITIETQNSTLGPDWKVTDEALESIVALITDVARRYNWGRVDSSRLKGHRDFANTNCPGPYLYPRFGWILAEVNKRLSGTGSSGIVSKPSGEVKPVLKSVNVVAREVIAGKWGNGSDRVARLTRAGYDARVVQAEVNRLLKGKVTVKPVLKSVNVVAREVIAGKWGNGSDRVARLTRAGYDARVVQAEVNRLLKVGK